MSIAGAFGDFGGAVSSIFSGMGDEASAKAYGEAAAIEGDAASLAGGAAEMAKQQAAVKAAQTQLQVNQTIGAQQADIGGAGLKSGGSNINLLMSSTQQGALAVGTATQQGAVNALGFQIQQQGLLAQQVTDLGLQQAAQFAADSSFIGGAIKGIAGIASLAML